MKKGISVMIAGGGSRARLGAPVLGLLLAVAGAQAASAQSCQEDFQKLSEKRNAQMLALNKIGKAAKGKMDPIAACPVARRLVVIETEMFAYLEKNKEWCNIPEQMVDNFKQQRAKTQGFASQACSFAAKAKKMQEEQAAGIGPQAVKLPAGPL
jgi:succinate dehydrogenase/fumarate reductase-like Fe-S protein